MMDVWKETLRCPTCLKTGIANLCQAEEDELATIQFVPDGFRVVTTRYGPNFQCTDCDVAVKP